MAPGNGASIRITTDSDWIELERLIFSLFPHAAPTNGSNDAYFAAETLKDGFVGFAHVRIFQSHLLLQGISVIPSMRKKGLGKELLDFAASWASDNFPGKPLKLAVDAGNAPAISLYLKDGFMVSKDEGGHLELSKPEPS